MISVQCQFFVWMMLIMDMEIMIPMWHTQHSRAVNETSQSFSVPRALLGLILVEISHLAKCINKILIVKAQVGAFNKATAHVGTFSRKCTILWRFVGSSNTQADAGASIFKVHITNTLWCTHPKLMQADTHLQSTIYNPNCDELRRIKTNSKTASVP